MRSIVVTRRARRQLERASEWWLSNRDKAPEAFDEDVTAGFDAITKNPSIYPSFDVRRGIRRIMLDRIRYYLYYRVNANGDVEVLSVWHASRRPPRL